MSINEARRRFPNCSDAFIRANCDPAGGEASSAKPEPPVRHEPVAEEKGEAENPTRFLVCITSFRRRLIDPDNLVPKFFIDCLRYCGAIPNDSAKEIELSVSQHKVHSSACERTEIEVIPL